MTLRNLMNDLGKLILCGAAIFLGTMVGGMIARLLQLPLPTPPQGADMNEIALFTMLTTPLLAFALMLVARGLAGNFFTRALILAFFMWIAYTVNTQLEASIVSTYMGFQFAITIGLFSALLGGAMVALLFPPEKPGTSVTLAIKSYFARRKPLAWAWRLPLAAVVFMPIYFAFGLMVLPFTGEYYRQNMFGLVAPTIEQLLPILFIRSVLFALACLPIIVLWQKTDRALFWRLGTALFFLVGFVIMLYATWLPIYVRAPHMLEILADEFIYAGALVLLLGRGITVAKQQAVIGKEQLTV